MSAPNIEENDVVWDDRDEEPDFDDPVVFHQWVSGGTRSSSHRTASVFKRSLMTVTVPPADKLGIILANKAESRGTIVSGVRVRTPSVSAELICPGDRIIAIDGEDVSLMDISEIASIMARKKGFERKLTLMATRKHSSLTSQSRSSPTRYNSSAPRAQEPEPSFCDPLMDSSAVFRTVRAENPQALPSGRPIPAEWDSPEEEYQNESAIMLALAQQNYETFYKLKAGTVPPVVLEHSSAGIAGWASCVLSDEQASPKKSMTPDDTSKKRKLEDPQVSIPCRKRGDDEEARELQLALLESIGVDVGVEAKRSLLHDMNPFVAESGDESEDEGTWSVESLEEEPECVSLQSLSSDEGDGNGETGLSPLAERLYLESSDSDDSASSFVIVKSKKGKQDASTSGAVRGSDETGLSLLASALRLDASEDEKTPSEESYVAISNRSEGSGNDHSSCSSDEWALL